MSLSTDVQYSRVNTQEPTEDVESGRLNLDSTTEESGASGTWNGRKVALTFISGSSLAICIISSFLIGRQSKEMPTPISALFEGVTLVIGGIGLYSWPFRSSFMENP